MNKIIFYLLPDSLLRVRLTLRLNKKGNLKDFLLSLPLKAMMAKKDCFIFT